MRDGYFCIGLRMAENRRKMQKPVWKGLTFLTHYDNMDKPLITGFSSERCSA